ncbi:retropepsin-like domain-containing protein [Myxococcota bacterium]|nr:retropepsin-like domain-containing protein [Myxococcota bacterium]
MNLGYTRFPRVEVWRPCVYARLFNRPASRFSPWVPFLIDTGSDRCLFDAELAHGVGINPVDGGVVSGAVGLGGRVVTTLWPIEVEFAELGVSLRIHAEFTNSLPADANGLLGQSGFLDRFRSVCFQARERTFSIES